MTGSDAQRTAVIGGIGESRFAARLDEPFQDYQLAAIERAIADAGLVPDDIEAIYSESTVMPSLCPTDVIESALGMSSVAHRAYMSGPGTGLGLAAMTAAEHVVSGRIEAALVYFGVNWGTTRGAYSFHDRYSAKSFFEHPYGFYGQPTYFALMAKRYAHDHGLSDDDLGEILGSIAVEQRANAVKNDNAQMRDPITMDDYWESRLISDPLRLYDCCLLSDGAAAFVVTSLATARRSTRARHAAVLGAGYASLPDSTDEAFLTQAADYPKIAAAGKAARAAYAMAGVTPSQVDFAEIYDCFSISMLLQLEELGVCDPGGGGEYLRRPTTGPGRRMAVNTHGGLLSQAYLLGINHFTEAVKQIRGEAGNGQLEHADIGVVSEGPNSDHAVIVLGGVE